MLIIVIQKHCYFLVTCRFSTPEVSFIHVQSASRRLLWDFIKLLLLVIKQCFLYIGRVLQVVRERRNTGMKEVRNCCAFIAILLCILVLCLHVRSSKYVFFQFFFKRVSYPPMTMEVSIFGKLRLVHVWFNYQRRPGLLLIITWTSYPILNCETAFWAFVSKSL